MIIVNAKLDGENTYDITIGDGTIYRASAFILDDAIDRVADYIEKHNKGLYVDGQALKIMSECSKNESIEAFAKAHNLTCCGANGIYIEITNVKGCPNG